MPTSRRELNRIEKGKQRNVPKYALDGPNLVTPVVITNTPEMSAMQSLDTEIKTLSWLRDFTPQDKATAQRTDSNILPIIQ